MWKEHMNDTQIIPAKGRDHRICHMAAEHVASELLEAHDRIKDLEADLRIYREIATAGIHALHQAHRREQRRRLITREQYAALRTLRATVEALRARLHIAERRAA